MKIPSIIFIVILVSMPALADTAAFRLNSGAAESLSNDTGDAFYNRISAEIFKRLGMQLTYIRLPSERSLIQANKGIDDGNIARIAGMEKEWPNLVQVPESIITWEFTAYSQRDDIQVSGWESLKPYTVGHVRGWQIYNKKTRGAKKVIQANDPAQLFGLLKKGRIDLALFERFQAPYWFDKTGYMAKRLSPELAKKQLYIYVHKKHSKLVPNMVDAIRQMKKDGSYQQIFNQSFNYKK